MSYITFENVTKEYRTGGERVLAANQVSFEMEKGELCVVLGPSGAGKTTILNLLGGMDKATSGRITVGGKRYTFTVNYEQSEYDGIYMEDYAVCLTDTSLPLLKVIAQQKTDKPIQVEYLSLGEVVFSAQVIIPGQDAALIYDRFVDYGGKKQDLSWYDAMWPCKVEKVAQNETFPILLFDEHKKNDLQNEMKISEN